MPKTIQERFFMDPEWHLVTDAIQQYIEPMRDILTVDVTKDAEDVKAQVIARQMSYENLDKFLQDSKIISKPISEENLDRWR